MITYIFPKTEALIQRQINNNYWTVCDFPIY